MTETKASITIKIAVPTAIAVAVGVATALLEAANGNWSTAATGWLVGLVVDDAASLVILITNAALGLAATVGASSLWIRKTKTFLHGGLTALVGAWPIISFGQSIVFVLNII